MDTIRLTGISATGHHGVFEAEKRQGQPFVVDAVLELDLRPAGRSDALEDTVSYAGLAALIERAITGESMDLIEALAQRIAVETLSSDERIFAAEITVHKPQAPLEQTFVNVSVTVRRSRADLTASSQPALQAPRPKLAGHYDGELVDDGPDAARAFPEEFEEEGTYVTETAQLGPYDRVSLSDLAEEQFPAGTPAGTSPEAPTRDPDLAADFPVRSVLALGSNLGDSRSMLASAVRALQAAEGVDVVRTSPLASTKPVGGPAGQRDYLNQVIEVETSLSPHALLALAQSIEADHNRVREQRWGPRTLDVDIVTYASAVIDSPRLQVPHPGARDRAFVLMPWSWMDPIALLDGHPVRELAARAEDAADVVPVDDDVERSDAEQGEAERSDAEHSEAGLAGGARPAGETAPRPAGETSEGQM